VGAQVQAVRRRGKWIRIELANGQTVLAHLRMTGRLTVVDAGAPRQRHLHLEWHIDGGPEQLRYNDPRRFGRFRLVPTSEVQTYLGARGFGPEPFDVDPAEFARRIGRGRRSIKAALLDQSVVAGLGNIYADETLFRAKIDPRLATARLGPARLRRIHTAMRAVLVQAIDAQGTTLRNYATSDGQSGRYQFQLSVFRRTGSPCPACGRPVRRVKLAGRSTHFCPGCQKR
jgi:formamidopyrimidine-DNA glycosylase